MEKGKIVVVYGSGKGKTTSAIGKGIKYLGDGKTVNMIQFLKGRREEGLMDVLKQLEPDMKAFRFEKNTVKFSELSDSEKEEELINIRNGISFARKVISTGSCDLLILDEVLGLVDRGIIEESELIELVKGRHEEMNILLTGRVLQDGIRTLADEVYRIDVE